MNVQVDKSNLKRLLQQRELPLAGFFIIVMLVFYFVLGDPMLGPIYAHWIPEMFAFALVGSALADLKFSWKRLAVLFGVCLMFGYLAQGLEGIPQSIFIMSPLVIIYSLKLLVVRRKRNET